MRRASWSAGVMVAGAGAATALSLLLSVRPAPAAAAPDGAAALSEARLLEAAIRSVTALVAPFTQTLESPTLPSPQVEEGTLYLERPGRMRWEYRDPPGKLAIADGRRAWLFLPEERQVLVGDLAADPGAHGVALLLEADPDLARAFDVAWGPEPRGGGRRPLRLTPRAARAAYAHLLVTTDAEHFPRALSVVDPLGHSVTYRLGRPRRVDDLDDALFRFTPPPGVDVQEMRP